MRKRSNSSRKRPRWYLLQCSLTWEDRDVILASASAQHWNDHIKEEFVKQQEEKEDEEEEQDQSDQDQLFSQVPCITDERSLTIEDSTDEDEEIKLELLIDVEPESDRCLMNVLGISNDKEVDSVNKNLFEAERLTKNGWRQMNSPSSRCAVVSSQPNSAGKLECKICDLKFKASRKFMKHMSMHEKKCKICYKVFQCNVDFIRHKKIHLDTNSGRGLETTVLSPCQPNIAFGGVKARENAKDCEMQSDKDVEKDTVHTIDTVDLTKSSTCRSQVSWKRNSRRCRNKENQYLSSFVHVCLVCKSQHSSKEEMNRHISRFHSQADPKCSQCSKQFRSSTHLRTHIRLKHRKLYSNNNFVNNHKNTTNKSNSSNKHNVNNVDNKDQESAVSASKVPQTSQFVLGESSSSDSTKSPGRGTKANRCKPVLTSSNFSKPSVTGAKGLKLVETCGGLYTCEECALKFCDRTSLRRHVLSSHRGNEHVKFVCTVCGERFAMKTVLSAHVTHCTSRRPKCKMRRVRGKGLS